MAGNPLLDQIHALWQSPAQSVAFQHILDQVPSDDVLQHAADVVGLDQSYRWKTAAPMLVEDYLNAVPQWREDPQLILDFTAGEFLARLKIQHLPQVAEYTERFPQLSTEVRQRLTALSTTNAAGNTARSLIRLSNLNDAIEIDDICDRFEQVWREADSPPYIEAWICHGSALKRSELLKELLRVELCLRVERGETPAVEEYRARFPDQPLFRDVLNDWQQHPKNYLLDGVAVHGVISPTMIGMLQLSQSESGSAELQRNLRISHFRLIAELGRGAFGRVYRAHDEHLDRVVAIKIPRKSRLKRPEVADLYLTEARMVSRLDHVGIVPIYQAGRTEDGTLYLVSRLINGPSLDGLLKVRTPDTAWKVSVVSQIARALHYAHQHRVIHRDIKPANILIDEETEAPFVTDFGLAVKEDDFLKYAGQLAGTPAYMSPEQARREGHRLDGRSDVFSLGVILYELLTEHRPFRGRTQEEVLHQVISVDPVLPRAIDSQIPAELERICLKAISKRASDRYATAEVMAEDLEAWLQPSATTAEEQTARLPIVSRGLRSFDAQDADFFLQLLPGTRGRDGLPDSIAFWKQKIEETDAALTFSVGLIYGPSGCGKSSLVKAGLLPHLASGVIAVYLEATPEETELRILTGLRKRIPAFDPGEHSDDGQPGSVTAEHSPPALDLSLTETLILLRRDHGPKVVVIIDQFEQWLHSHGADTEAELVQALRHCDGTRLQAIVMIRDDFAMAAARFMQAVEVPILQGHNFATVDLFEVDHARNVLIKFGQGFGRLPADTENLSSEEQQFVDAAVTGLAQDGKVVSVRLSLFAEMVKTKTWSPETLQAVGGTQGIGVNFLEETFSSPRANPTHRLHAAAARGILKSLLPDVGTDIKGHMRSQQELLEASGYADRPTDFTNLLRILDGELRLITPTDPEGDSIRDSTGSSPSALRFYQLTHDYLVPSLREWLTKKQKETRKGRAELKLEERTALWTAKPENRHLPSLAEWTAIRTLTDRDKWTEAQRTVMRRATRVHGSRLLLGLTASMLLIVGGVWTKSRVDDQQAQTSASGLVAALLSAETRDVPKLVSDLIPYRQWADPELQAALESTDTKTQLHARIALLPVDASQVDRLQNALLDTTPENVLVLREVLQASGDRIAESYWPILQSPASTSQQRVAAAAALARFAPDDERWKEVAGPVSNLLVNENPLRLATWIEAFRPVRTPLIPELGMIFRDQTEAVTPTQRELATNLLETYAADDLNQLSELILDANPKQFASLFDEFQSHGDAAIANLDTEINRVLTPQWDDPPLDAAWTEPPDQIVQAIQRAAGMITERFACCQTLPLSEFQKVADRLGKSGYRPVRLRPYAHQRTVQVAAAWTRDGRSWRVETKGAVDSILDQDETQRNDGFVAVDVAGYLGEQDGQPVELYAAVWVERQNAGEDARVYAGVPYEQHKEAYGELLKVGYEFRQALQGFRGLDGNQLYCGVRSNSGGGGSSSWNQTVAKFDAKLYLDKIHWDIDPSVAAVPESTKQRNETVLVDAEDKLKQNSADLNARFARGKAGFYLGQNEKALADMGHLVQMAPGLATAYQYRSILYARLGDADAARFDLQHFAERNASETPNAYVDVIVSAYLGDEAEAIKRLELMIEENQDKDGTLYDSACAYSVASGVYEEQDVTRAKLYADRAVALLERAIEAGYTNYSHMQDDPDLDPIRDHDGFLALMKPGNLDLRYTAVWNESSRFESKESHGLSPEKHVQQCRKFQDQGYRLVSVSAASVNGDIVTASVWHRPRISRQAREALARRQANAATAMARLSQHDKLFPALRVTDDPESLTQFVHRCRESGITTTELLELLNQTDQTRQALNGQPRKIEDRVLFGLLLALGEFPLSDVPESGRSDVLDKVADWFANDPSSAIHGATGWLLRQWGQTDIVKRVDQTPLAYDPNREWFTLAIKADDQTFYQTYVVIQPGEYDIGSPADEPRRDSDEKTHRVRLTRPVAILDREVTRGEFEASEIYKTSSTQISPSGDHPMVGPSWYDSVKYCRWLSERAGFTEADQAYADPKTLDKASYPLDGDSGSPKNWPVDLAKPGFRLPTEAEWEIAARVGMRSMYGFGSDENLLDRYAWYQDNSNSQTHVAKELRPNLGGLFDMHGNVYEWCHNWYAGYATSSMQVDPKGGQTGSSRVLRGGCWINDAGICRSAYRNTNVPTSRGTPVGFRLALSFPSGKSPEAEQEPRAEPGGVGTEGAQAEPRPEKP